MQLLEAVCDSHDGVEVEGYEVISRTQIRVDDAHRIVKQMTDMLDSKYVYHNKYVVIVSETYSTNPIYTGVYSYDDRYFGVVLYRRKQ